MPRITTIPAGPSTHETLASRGVVLLPTTPEARAGLLDGTPWTHRFTWKQLATLAHYMRLYRVEPGRCLFREGDHDAFLAVVLGGVLEIRKGDSSQHERVVARLGRGKLVGEMSLLDGASRSATAVAAEVTELLVLTRTDFSTLGDEHPTLGLSLALAIALTLSQLLRQTTGTLVEYLES